MVDVQNLITQVVPVPSINYSGEWTFSYLKGQTLFVDEDETGHTYKSRGMVMVAMSNFLRGSYPERG